jgi:methyltransferase (TIGR00027 family)
MAEELENMTPANMIQVVNLGAGMCTRSWRLPEVDADLIWFEVDRPDSVHLKQQIIRENKIQPGVNAFYSIGVDFNEPNASLTQALEEHGFDSELPTIFVMEGFLPYLTVEEIEELASEIDELVTGPTCLVMTQLSDSMLYELKNPTEELKKKYPGTDEVAPLFQSSWESGTEQAFLNAGWQTTFVMSREEYGREYLGVEMLDSNFPVQPTSTEHVIVAKRAERSLFDFFSNPFVCKAQR